MFGFDEGDVGVDHGETEERDVHGIIDAEVEQDASEQHPVAKFFGPNERSEGEFDRLFELDQWREEAATSPRTRVDGACGSSPGRDWR